MSMINLYESYNNKRRKFGVNDSSRFRQAFVEATNSTYSELNSQVFKNQTLGYISSFDDIIDDRLFSFSTLTFLEPAERAMESREFWSIEYDLERLSSINGLTDTITDDGSNVVLSITNGVFSVVGGAISATVTLPSNDTPKLRFESTADGNALYIDDDLQALVYTLGDADTAQAIGAITSRVISGTSGYTIGRTSFSSDGMLIFNFLINEGGTETTISDEVSAFNGGTPYTATLVNPVWNTVYIAPSSSLDSQYRSVFETGMDFWLEQGGEWALENEEGRERRWYGRGIQMARNIMQANSTYTGPLGI